MGRTGQRVIVFKIGAGAGSCRHEPMHWRRPDDMCITAHWYHRDEVGRGHPLSFALPTAECIPLLPPLRRHGYFIGLAGARPRHSSSTI